MSRSAFVTAMAIFASILPCPASYACFGEPQPLPIERIVANLESRLEANLDDHEAWYTLARAHYLAFYNGNAKVRVYVEGVKREPAAVGRRRAIESSIERWAAMDRAKATVLARIGYSKESDVPPNELQSFKKQVDEEASRFVKVESDPDKLSIEDVLEHARLSIVHFEKAITMAPQNALYHLGLASLYLQYVEFRESRQPLDEPEALKAVTLSDARGHFFSAYTYSIDEHLKLSRRPPGPGLELLVGYESGTTFLKLVESTQDVPQRELDGVASVKKALKKLERLKKPRFVSPIIFAMEQHASLADLLDADAAVLFDLDGDDVREEWPWVKPTTGFLVWDDLDTGQITSGRQLFGSVTWWLFFRHGYHALDALDDDRDGALSGHEMDGIAVWFDHNVDGVSDPGEVVSLQSLGITAIGVHATGVDDGAPMNSEGLTLSGGRTLATYDWIASPVE